MGGFCQDRPGKEQKMKVAVEVSQVMSKMFIVEIPDNTPRDQVYDAVFGARSSWVDDTDWSSPMDDPSTDAIYPVVDGSEGQEVDAEHPLWPDLEV